MFFLKDTTQWRRWGSNPRLQFVWTTFFVQNFEFQYFFSFLFFWFIYLFIGGWGWTFMDIYLFWAQCKKKTICGIIPMYLRDYRIGSSGWEYFLKYFWFAMFIKNLRPIYYRQDWHRMISSGAKLLSHIHFIKRMFILWVVLKAANLFCVDNCGNIELLPLIHKQIHQQTKTKQTKIP